MDGQFAQQLANLQRAASRSRDSGSGSGSGGGGGGRGAGSASGSSRGDGGRDDDRHGRYDDNSRRGDYRGSGRDGRGGGGYYDNRNRWETSSRREYNPRKRDRYEMDDGGYRDRGSRDYNDRYQARGGSSSYRGGRGGGGRGRFGGRGQWNDRDRDRAGDYRGGDGPPRGADVPLVDLVEKVAERYKSSLLKDNSASVVAGKSDNMTTTTVKKKRHIALLFLTIEDLPHEAVWNEWLKSSDSDAQEEDVMVSVICHAKYPDRIKSEWLRRRHLLLRKRTDNVNQNNSDNTNSNNSEALKTEGNDGGGNGYNPATARFHTRRPEWGSIEITRAMIDLLEEGLRLGTEEGRGGLYRRYLSTPMSASAEGAAADDRTSKEACTNAGVDVPPVDRFVFVSESCLPVATLAEVETALFGPRSAPNESESTSNDEKQMKTEALYNKSWINARSTPNNGYARQLQWDAISASSIPPSMVWKADQWLVLNRTHAYAVASIPKEYLAGRQLWPAFKKCRASDEMYFPSALSILGILHRPAGGGEVEDDATMNSKVKESCAGEAIRRRRITYCDWSMGAKNPASFTSKEWKEVVAKARAGGCLFARKFVAESSMVRGGGGGRKRGGEGQDGNDGLISVEAWRDAIVKK